MKTAFGLILFWFGCACVLLLRCLIRARRMVDSCISDVQGNEFLFDVKMACLDLKRNTKSLEDSPLDGLMIV